MPVILLFDDVPTNQTDFASEFRKLNSRFELQPFDASKQLPEACSYERHIEGQLVDLRGTVDLVIVACDKELGAYPNYRGLSANAVSAVCKNLGLPFCQYSRNFGVDDRELERFEKLQRWDSEDVTLEGRTISVWAAEIVGLADGFEEIRKKHKAEFGATKKISASEILARVMGRPHLASSIELYGSGDQTVMTEIFAFTKSGLKPTDTFTRMPRILGNWLWLSIIRFPGILLNKVAASSFLNVSVADFQSPESSRHFEAAKYKGPFSKLGEWWWRDDLESMLLDDAVDDGKGYLMKRGVNASACVDAQTGERAGYYCMITHQPVSHQNSVGGINWFPSGANLARIRRDKFDDITSLVSI